MEEDISGLPFYVPNNKIDDYMTVGKLIEWLIYLKDKYDIGYPDDTFINKACNILENFDPNMSIRDANKL